MMTSYSFSVDVWYGMYILMTLSLIALIVGLEYFVRRKKANDEKGASKPSARFHDKPWVIIVRSASQYGHLLVEKLVSYPVQDCRLLCINDEDSTKTDAIFANNMNFSCSFSDDKQVPTMLAEIHGILQPSIATGDRIHAIVFCHQTFIKTGCTEYLTLTDYHTSMQMNFFLIVAITLCLLPLMKDGDSKDKKASCDGRLIFLLPRLPLNRSLFASFFQSQPSLSSLPLFSAFATSIAALKSWLRTLQLEEELSSSSSSASVSSILSSSRQDNKLKISIIPVPINYTTLLSTMEKDHHPFYDHWYHTYLQQPSLLHFLTLWHQRWLEKMIVGYHHPPAMSSPTAVNVTVSATAADDEKDADRLGERREEEKKEVMVNKVVGREDAVAGEKEEVVKQIMQALLLP